MDIGPGPDMKICALDVLGAPPPSGNWAVTVVLRNENSIEMARSNQHTLNVGDSDPYDEGLGGLGPNVEWTYTTDNPTPTLEFTYKDIKFTTEDTEHCAVHTDQGVPQFYCQFECRG